MATAAPAGEVTIRNYDKESDRFRMEDFERGCEVGPSENASLVVDTMGDPLCRIRNSPLYKMLVAEVNKELVGVIRGTIKVVTVRKHQAVTAGYILGLRVSPLHRRKGIGLRLVGEIEEWFVDNHVDLAYMATEKENEASVKLFIEKLQYVKFRTPSILVNPVSQNPICLSPRVKILKLKVEHAERLYRRFMGSTEFFPHDIDRILEHKLNSGTWIAYHQGEPPRRRFDFEENFPTSWAMLSVWNSGEVFKLRVDKPSLACLTYAKTSSFIDRFFPCFRFPFLPDVFSPFGFYFMYGLYQEGPTSGSLMRTLCQLVHNMATKCEDCKVIVTEVAGADKLRRNVPHSKVLSCPEDLWCIKALKSEWNCTFFDLTRAPYPSTIFIDPREV